MKSISQAAITAAIMLMAIAAALIMAAAPWTAAEAQTVNGDISISIQPAASDS
ncbi:hypothetical protein FHW67_003839 [Herbaspirillum sp. Sphag1AN]|uniref:hypothetical protein n=1 Tax=unclassified Herbaspirillum TaxID=2624150 RepID=UPI0016104C3F|nr:MULTISPECIES: hypothetical protein [unclassified Herbaspirillum]MBB3214521.1 hypothetical protein [Herbaspirillum sp. Sphag1AN]MBB3247639.1 hypothetical protein [Herbaspirillum sp. Sphag64]